MAANPGTVLKAHLRPTQVLSCPILGDLGLSQVSDDDRLRSYQYGPTARLPFTKSPEISFVQVLDFQAQESRGYSRSQISSFVNSGHRDYCKLH